MLYIILYYTSCLENYTPNYTYTYSFFILYNRCHAARMQTKFCPNISRRMKGLKTVNKDTEAATRKTPRAVRLPRTLEKLHEYFRIPAGTQNPLEGTKLHGVSELCT